MSQLLIGGCNDSSSIDVGYTISIVAVDATAKESDLSTGQFQITINKWRTTDLTVYYEVGGSAVGGLDYSALSGSVVIPAGYKTASIAIIPFDDTTDEGDFETVYVAIYRPAGYASNKRSATVKILDDDDPVIPVVQISAVEPTAEENGGSGQFKISLSALAPSNLTIHYSVAGSTATPGTDYDDAVLSTGEITIPVNTASALIDVTTVPDEVAEDQETVIVTLSEDPLDPDTYTVGAANSATVTIVDDDAPSATIATTGSVATEGGASGQFTVTMSEPVVANTTVNYTVSGTATPGDDYFTLTGTVVVNATQSTAVIPVLAIDDDLTEGVEGPESVVVTLAAATGATVYTVGAEDTATVVISGAEAPTASITATDAVASETGDAGVFRISLDQTVATDVVITYLAGGGASTDGSDYTELLGTVTILAGQTFEFVTIEPVLDYLTEGLETVTLTLNPGPGYLVDGGADNDTVTISDYQVPVVSVINGTDAQEAPLANGKFVLSIATPPAEELTINYAISGSAEEGVDFSEMSGSVTVPQGYSGTVDVIVIPIEDSDIEGDEDVILTLSSEPGGAYKVSTVPEEQTFTILIIDASPPPAP